MVNLQLLFLNEGLKFANPSFVSCALLVVLFILMRQEAALLVFIYVGMRREQPFGFYICWCSVSRWRPQKVDKRMVLEHTHGLFIT